MARPLRILPPLAALVLTLATTGCDTVPPTEYVYPHLNELPANAPWCLPSNPHCGHEPWFIEYTDAPDGHWTQFSFLPPGLVVDSRLDETVYWLAAWPEGRELLTKAGQFGIWIGVGERSDEFAAFYDGQHQINFNPDYIELGTPLLSAIMAHELTHARDHIDGRNQAEGYEACIAREQSATEAERRFLSWVNAQVHPLPPFREVARSISPTDQGMYRYELALQSTHDIHAFTIRRYDRRCRTQ